MAGSRLEKIGTVFSRVTSLLRSNAMKREDRPLWYDVYQVFPPKIEPSYGTIRSIPEIRNIFYPEDKIRAKFHKRILKMLPAENLLEETTSDITYRAINQTYKLMHDNESLTEDEAIEKVIESMKKEGVLKKKNRPPKHSIFQAQSVLKNTSTIDSEVEQQDQLVNPKAELNARDKSDKPPIKRTYVNDFEDAMKNISNKNVDVTKNVSEDDK